MDFLFGMGAKLVLIAGLLAGAAGFVWRILANAKKAGKQEAENAMLQESARKSQLANAAGATASDDDLVRPDRRPGSGH